MIDLGEGTARARIYEYLGRYESTPDDTYAPAETTKRAISHALKIPLPTTKATLVSLSRLGLVEWRYARVRGVPKRIVVYSRTGRETPLALSQNEMARIRQHLKEIDKILGSAAISSRG